MTFQDLQGALRDDAEHREYRVFHNKTSIYKSFPDSLARVQFLHTVFCRFLYARFLRSRPAYRKSISGFRKLYARFLYDKFPAPCPASVKNPISHVQVTLR